MTTEATQRSEIEFSEDGDVITDRMEKRYRIEIACGACGKIFYADSATAAEINRQIEHDLDNPFLCADCRSKLEEQIIEDR